MADNVQFTQGSGTTLSTDDVGGGVQVQRVKVQWGVDGTAVDASTTNPIPVDNVEFPAAAALSDVLANPTTTFVGANNLLWDATGSQWVRARAASADGASATGVQEVVVGVWSGASNLDRVRSSNTDAQANIGIIANGPMLYNGATYDRARTADPAGGNRTVGVAAISPHVSDGAANYIPTQRAASTGDGTAGNSWAPASPYLYNGATFDRQRGSIATDAVAATGIAAAQPLAYNGATYDRIRGNIEGTVLASAARTVTTASATQTNHNARGVIIGLWVSARASATTLTLSVSGVDAVSANANALTLSGVLNLAAGQGALVVVYPGTTALVASGSVQSIVSVSGPLPRSWQVVVTPSDANSVTYSVSYALIL